MKPLAIDLYCGLGGWAEGFISEGYRVIGFDVEAHDYGTGGYPGELVLRDVRSIHGSEFKDAAIIVASPPCQAYSYRAMPWKRAKALPPPDNTLFDACFRIQREASAAAGRYIPLIVENVRGAQKWVGRARWHFGSYFLWGDVPALMPITVATVIKNNGGSWFAVAHNTESGHSKNPVNCSDARSSEAVKVGGIDFNGPKAVGFNVTAAQRYREGVKVASESGRRTDVGNGACFTSRDCGIEREGVKQSKSDSRKAASAMIAKIPFPLAQHIARSYKPEFLEVCR